MPQHVLRVLLVIILAGCGSTPRNAISEADLATARPYGIAGLVRVWGDSVGADQRDELLRGIVGRFQRFYAEEIARNEPITQNVLAISGGGAYGAFGAGVMVGWTERGDRPTFDIVTGVSTGAIIGLLAFLGPDYDDDLKRFYTEYSTEDLLRPAFFVALRGGSSVADTSGYRAIIDDFVDDVVVSRLAVAAARGRTLLIGTTNLDASRPVVWNLSAIAASGHPMAKELIRDVIQASSAIPAVMPPVVIPSVTADGETFDEVHVDGGATQQVMLFSPELPISEVDRVLNARIDRSIHIVMNNSARYRYDPVGLDVLSIAGKAMSSLIGGAGAGDIYKIFAIAQRDGIDFNAIWIPESFEEEPEEPFDIEFMGALFEVGNELGREGGSWGAYPPNFAPGSRG